MSGHFRLDSKSRSFSDFGDHDGCHDLKIDLSSYVTVNGRYCLLLFRPDYDRFKKDNFSSITITEIFGMPIHRQSPLDSSLKIGLCTLPFCKTSDIKLIS